MVSKRQSRVWGINRICSVCYQSFLARNPIVKRCDECMKDDFFDENTESIEPDSTEHNNKIDYFASTLSSEELLYKEAEEYVLSRFRLTATERRSLNNLSDVMRKEIWE
ncbi:hypothetical protein LCGC14_1266360 [marine sediment metagenome]|uniref:Uncharacterized protein n=1 Tax=marine sediment metagenome TaxID=412755 RepID=A0A0F9L1F3_9ZZZZ